MKTLKVVAGSNNWTMTGSDMNKMVVECPDAVCHVYDAETGEYVTSFQNGHEFSLEIIGISIYTDSDPDENGESFPVTLNFSGDDLEEGLLCAKEMDSYWVMETLVNNNFRFR